MTPNGQGYPPPKLDLCWDALRNNLRIAVTTASRRFEGYVYEIGRSPFHPDFTCRVVDDEGRVHYFRPLRDDSTVTLL